MWKLRKGYVIIFDGQESELLRRMYDEQDY